MLNTIYEEFDFSGKIKELKNKKIKIKRVIKGKDGEPDIVRESIIISKERAQETNKLIQELTRKKEKNSNPMFYSQTNFEIKPHIQPPSSQKPDQTSLQASSKPVIGPQIDYEEPRAKEKGSNPMFMSQNTTVITGIGGIITN